MLIYTFSTFPWRDKLENPFIFRRIKQELKKFEKLLDTEDVILGVAKSPFNYPLQEPVAVNKFNQNKVDKAGRESYSLDLLPSLNLKTRIHPTTSFCNYAAYKIEQLLENFPEKKHSFVHVAKEADLDFLVDLLQL